MSKTFGKWIRRPWLLGVAGGMLVASLLLQYWPLPSSLQNRDYARLILADNGELLGARIAGDQQWRFAPVTELPDKYEQALLLFEDRRFRLHPGIDPLAIARASWGNIKAGRVTSGGSTLTMQLARMLRDDPPRTLPNKALEALSALHLEWHFSKDELLNFYASHAPFGGNIVGLRAAAWRYFGREPEQLSWAEAATLAVLPNSPALIHPGRDRERLRQKRDHLLHRLTEAGALSKLDLTLALREPLPERPRPLPHLAPHLLTTLAAEAPSQAVFHTTLNADLQRRTQQIAEQQGRRLARDGVHNLSILVLDHERMRTLAYVGNQAAGDSHAPAVDIIQRPRSTGSILKPLLYGLMLEEGELLPTTLVPDIPAYFGGYRPENYDRQYRGAVPAHRALARSLNVPAVHMLKDYGIERLHHRLQELGVSTLHRPAEDYGLSLILGGAEGTLWELTNLYARMTSMARAGTWPAEAQRIHGEHGEAKGDPGLGQGAAWLTLQALLNVVRPGTDALWRDFSGSQAIAWKTGTSYGLRDAWAIGSNGRYTVGVWAGNAGGEPAPALSGQKSAAPVLFEVFAQLGNHRWFDRPTRALKTVSVCITDGYLAGGQCESREIDIPRHSHFQQVTPHYQRVQLDATGQYRVHAGCERVSAMVSADLFTLPPLQAHFWRLHHSDYRPVPPWRPDCLAAVHHYADDQPMDLLYPREGSQVYIPLELSGRRGRTVLQAVHRHPEGKLFWHLDDRYLGKTRLFHEQAVSLDPGWHKLRLVDGDGYQLERWFRVLGGEG
ncbi:penicillin-binding protein 1C [Marinimicrobium sp. LS-A18]|uniref:penicillin-binding protein 1C n=1 Tax=Marinimicrobium sp. LS-A18 TaxID=1381596 RepID=UPI0004651765|nr:penicillin-binding protein 1C [Marinimicrobium sp. LS-A18]